MWPAPTASSLAPDKTISVFVGHRHGRAVVGDLDDHGHPDPVVRRAATAVATKTNVERDVAASIIAVHKPSSPTSHRNEHPVQEGPVVRQVSGTSPANSIGQKQLDRENLDLKLDIKPHISPTTACCSRSIHTRKDFLGSSSDLARRGSRPALLCDHPRPARSRSAQGQVISCGDQQTVVNRRLISTKEIRTKTQIPISATSPGS